MKTSMLGKKEVFSEKELAIWFAEVLMTRYDPVTGKAVKAIQAVRDSVKHGISEEKAAALAEVFSEVCDEDDYVDGSAAFYESLESMSAMSYFSGSAK